MVNNAVAPPAAPSRTVPASAWDEIHVLRAGAGYGRPGTEGTTGSSGPR
ncbi:unnamed protein product [[Actinomadura] parvosata subsp. kistnae]|nr:unnamed protein product [Actinomadura parvosata subsp. kistnae]